MRLERLELRDFRNYARQSVEFAPGRNLIIGDNAQGKTNLLEAIACLPRGKSPAARADRELVRFGQSAAFVSASVFSRERDFHIELAYATDRRRSVRVNGVPGPAALRGVFHTVLFRPEDLSLVRDGPARRRRFLDNALSQLLPAYAAALSAYTRALAQKSRLLRDGPARPDLYRVLPDFNEQLARSGAVLIRCRARFIRRLREYAAQYHRDCSGGKEALDVSYQTVPGVNAPCGPQDVICGALRETMDKNTPAEKNAVQCIWGPHRDDLLLTIDGRDARAYASQGQTRTAALSLKLAERDLFRAASGESPALLLDDVLSELDPRRQAFVLDRAGEGQVFLTCCGGPLPGGGQARIFRVRAGTILTP